MTKAAFFLLLSYNSSCYRSLKRDIYFGALCRFKAFIIRRFCLRTAAANHICLKQYLCFKRQIDNPRCRRSVLLYSNHTHHQLEPRECTSKRYLHIGFFLQLVFRPYEEILQIDDVAFFILGIAGQLNINWIESS